VAKTSLRSNASPRRSPSPPSPRPAIVIRLCRRSFPSRHPFLAVIQRSVFRDEGPLFDRYVGRKTSRASTRPCPSSSLPVVANVFLGAGGRSAFRDEAPRFDFHAVKPSRSFDQRPPRTFGVRRFAAAFAIALRRCLRHVERKTPPRLHPPLACAFIRPRPQWSHRRSTLSNPRGTGTPPQLRQRCSKCRTDTSGPLPASG
jgi:hypothetical protein